MTDLESSVRTALRDATDDVHPPVGFASDAWQRGRRRRVLNLISISTAAATVIGLAVGGATLLARGQEHEVTPAGQPTPSTNGTHFAFSDMPPWMGPDCWNVFRPNNPPSAHPWDEICVPTVASGFPTSLVDFGISGPGGPGSTNLAEFIVGDKIQPGEDKDLTHPNGPQADIQVWAGGSFAKQGDPQLGPDVTSHTTALGESAAVIERDDGSAEVLVSARGYDIIAKGTGNYHGLTPVSVDQLVTIINSIRGLQPVSPTTAGR